MVQGNTIEYSMRSFAERIRVSIGPAGGIGMGAAWKRHR